MLPNKPFHLRAVDVYSIMRFVISILKRTGIQMKKTDNKIGKNKTISNFTVVATLHFPGMVLQIGNPLLSSIILLSEPLIWGQLTKQLWIVIVKKQRTIKH